MLKHNSLIESGSIGANMVGNRLVYRLADKGAYRKSFASQSLCSNVLGASSCPALSTHEPEDFSYGSSLFVDPPDNFVKNPSASEGVVLPLCIIRVVTITGKVKKENA